MQGAAPCQRVSTTCAAVSTRPLCSCGCAQVESYQAALKIPVFKEGVLFIQNNKQQQQQILLNMLRLRLLSGTNDFDLTVQSFSVELRMKTLS